MAHVALELAEEIAMDIGPIPVKDLVLATVTDHGDKIHIIHPVNSVSEEGIIIPYWSRGRYDEWESWRCLCGQAISENGFGEEFFIRFTWPRYARVVLDKHICRRCRAIFEKEYRGVGRVEDVIGEDA